MKLNYLLKALPFLSTFLLISFLTITNQKVYTKLRILIWNTPSLSVGTYLGISTGTGFLLSYLITSNLAKINNSARGSSLKFKDKQTFKEMNQYEDANTNSEYENTLIERDIKDPTPTINASFRIIGNKDGYNKNFVSENNSKYDKSFEFDNVYNDQSEIIETTNEENLNSNDWNDESFANW